MVSPKCKSVIQAPNASLAVSNAALKMHWPQRWQRGAVGLLQRGSLQVLSSHQCILANGAETSTLRAPMMPFMKNSAAMSRAPCSRPPLSKCTTPSTKR